MNPMLILIIAAIVLIVLFLGTYFSVRNLNQAVSEGLKDKKSGSVMNDSQFKGKLRKQAYRSGYLSQQILNDEGQERIEQLAKKH